MSRSDWKAMQKRNAEVAVYGSPVIPSRFPGTCGCGCGTKFGRGNADLVKWFGKWVLAPCVIRALDAAAKFSRHFEMRLSIYEMKVDSKPEQNVTNEELDKAERILR